MSGDFEQRLDEDVRHTLSRYDPTDTMPLTPMAKSLMAVQSLTALVTIGLVVARAVNIL